MLIKVAWRNIWRNKLRSGIVMIAIAVGIWAGIFASSIANGLNKQRLDNVIYSQTSHIQIHQKGYGDNFELSKFISGDAVKEESLESEEQIKAYSKRTLVTGMVASAASGKGVMIKGVDPNKEKVVSSIENYMVEGDYFEKKKKNPIVLGKTLAEKLNVRLKSKVVLTFQDMEGEIVNAAFRVVGLFKTNDVRNDEMSVYLPQEKLNELLGLEKFAYHELAILLKDERNLNVVDAKIKSENPDLLVQSWKELIPGLAATNVIVGRMNYLLLLILLAAMSFGIINTMLMAVLERVREFGMLMAVGMNKTKVFLMIMLETVFLMMTATPIGILLAYASISYFGKYGMDFSNYSEGFANVGVKPIIYPFQTADYYPKVIILVVIAAFLAAIYPALKAIRLNPAEAIRKI